MGSLVVGAVDGDIADQLAELVMAGRFGSLGGLGLFSARDLEKDGGDGRVAGRSVPCVGVIKQLHGSCFIIGHMRPALIAVELMHIAGRADGNHAGVLPGVAVVNRLGDAGDRFLRQVVALAAVLNVRIGAFDRHVAENVIVDDIVLGGLAGLVGLGRGFGFPYSVQGGGSGHNDAAAGLAIRSRCIGVGAPAEEGIPVAGRLLRGDSKGVRPLVLRLRRICLGIRCAGAAVGVVLQRKGAHNRCALEVIVRGVFAIGKQGAGSLTAPVAAASSPGDVVDLVVVNTIPDVFRIGEAEGIVVDIILAQVNGDVIAADACNRVAVDRVTDLDLHARHGVVNGRMQHNGAIGFHIINFAAAHGIVPGIAEIGVGHRQHGQ